MTSDEAEPEEHPGVAPLALRRSAVGHGPAGLEMSLALSSIVNRAYSVAVVAYVYGATGSTAMLGAAAASRYLAGLAAAAGTSFLLGRVRPKPLLLALNVLAAALLLACAQRMHAGAGAAVVIALAAAVRVVTVPLSPAATAMLPVVLGGRDLARAARRQNTIEKLALLVGPGAGGILLLVASPAGELAIIATLLPIAALATVRLPDVTVPVRSAPAGDVAGAGTRRGDSSAATLFGAFSVLAGFAYGCDTVLFAVLAEDRFDVGASGYGLLFACLGAGGLLAAAGANRATGRRHLGPLLVAALCLYCLPTAVLAFAHSWGVALALQVARGAGALLVDVLAITGLQRVVLPRRLPHSTAWLAAAVSASVAFAALATPLLVDGPGLDWALAAAGLALPLAALALLPRLGRAEVALAHRAEALAPRTRVLEHLGLLAGTSHATLELLAAGLTELDLPAGSVVVREGEVSDDLFVLVEGRADAYVGTSAGQPVLASRMAAGDWFGEIAALTGLPRTATVVTVEPCRLFRIEAETFRHALEHVPPSPGLLDAAVARLRRTPTPAGG